MSTSFKAAKNVLLSSALQTSHGRLVLFFASGVLHFVSLIAVNTMNKLNYANGKSRTVVLCNIYYYACTPHNILSHNLICEKLILSHNKPKRILEISFLYECCASLNP